MQKLSYRHIAAITLLTLLAACTPEEPKEYISRSNAFGHSLQLSLYGVAPEQGKIIVEDVLAEIHYLTDATHPWHAGSLGRTNQRLALTGEFSANPSLLPLIEMARRFEKQSQGYYAPAQGKLQQIWGFHTEIPNDVMPDEDALLQLLEAKPRMDNIHVNGISLRSDNPSVQLDFGPMAQGYALDIARQHLRELGITRAQVDNSNAIAILGEGWTVNLEGTLLPLHDGESVVTLDIRDKTFTAEDKTWHSYLNPFSGYPARGLQRVHVIHRNTATAAAFAQALLTAGSGKLDELLQVIPVEYVWVVTAKGDNIYSEAMKQRLDAMHD